MSDLPTSLASAARKLSFEGLGPNGQSAAERLKSAGFEIRRGLTPEYADQVLKMSKEPAIKEYCPKDSAERFSNRDAAAKWLAKGRAFYVLLKKDGADGQLAGYGWAGPGLNSHVAGGEVTFAVRIGLAGQGQGLAAPFSWLIIADAASEYGLRKFWLETWASNGAAVHIYHKLGFEDTDQVASERRRPDGTTIEDIRIYMSLADKLPKE